MYQGKNINESKTKKARGGSISDNNAKFNTGQSNLDVPELLKKLNELYDKEEQLIIQWRKITLEFSQLQEDKEMLQLMIMHKSNKNNRVTSWQKIRQTQ